MVNALVAARGGRAPAEPPGITPGGYHPWWASPCRASPPVGITPADPAGHRSRATWHPGAALASGQGAALSPPCLGEGQEHRGIGMWDTRCVPGTALHHPPMADSIPHPDPAGKGCESPRHPRVLSHRLAMGGGVCWILGSYCCLLSACARGRGTSEGKVGWTLPIWTSVGTGDDVGSEKQMGMIAWRNCNWTAGGPFPSPLLAESPAPH